MRTRSGRGYVVKFLAVLVCLLGSGWGESPALKVTGLGRAIVPLSGPWAFKTGDDRAWAAPGFDDTGWEQIGTDRGWGTQGHFAYTGYGWYRKHVEFSPVPEEGVALILPPSEGPYEVYWNGVLVGREGRMPPGPYWYFRPPPRSFGLGKAGTGVLAVRTWSAPLLFVQDGTRGGILSTPRVGTGPAVADALGSMDHAWLRDRQYYFVLNILYGLVGLLGLIAWAQEPSRKVLFWVSLFSLTQAIHVMLFNAHLPWHDSWAYGLDQVNSAIQDTALWFMLLYLLRLEENARLWRWTVRLAWFNLLTAALDLAVAQLDKSGPLADLQQIADGVLALPIALVLAYPLVIVSFAWGKRLDGASRLVAAAAVIAETINVVRVMVLQGRRFTHWHTVYESVTKRLFTIRGNYFDAANIAETVLLVCMLYAVYRYFVEQRHLQGRFEGEFRSAQELQRVLIPETLPALAGYGVTSAYRPALEVGGDFFQVLAQEDGAALVVLGDVSGKGLKAAMAVSLIVGTVRALAETFGEPQEILARLNRGLYGRLGGGFCTCLVVRVEADGRCVVANAGHLAPYLNGTDVETPPALPLGMDADAIYEKTEARLEVGDRMTLYTDGLLEARRAGELFGFERVRELMGTGPDAHEVSEAAVAFGQDDDITVLTVTRLGVGVEGKSVLVAPALVG